MESNVPRLNYRRYERNGFVWTTDTIMRGLRSYTKHRCYIPSDRNHPIATIVRMKGMYQLIVIGSLRVRRFGSLDKAKDTAEAFVSKNFDQLGFQLKRKGKAL